MRFAFAATRAEGCPSQLRLDRLVGGELTAAEAESTRRHVADCAACARHLAAIEGVRAGLLLAPLPLILRRSKRQWPGRAAAAAALLAAAAILLVAWPRRPVEAPALDGLRRKGAGRLGFYVKDGHGIRPGAAGEVLHAGDTVRFTLRLEQPRWVIILSVDGARHASTYFPDGARAERVEDGAEVALPASTELDDVLGTETIYALVCDHDVEVEPIRAGLAGAPERAPVIAGCTVESLAFEKRPVPR